MYEEGLFEDEAKTFNEYKFLDKVLLEVKKSQIHGKGVFALQEIHADKFFYSVPMDDLHKTPAPSLARISKNAFVNDPKVLNFVNHSCDPNCELVINQKGVFLRSIKLITKGGEITLDYTLIEEQNELVQCDCKSQNCRHFFFKSG
jgi:SET domain-containing protein